MGNPSSPKRIVLILVVVSLLALSFWIGNAAEPPHEWTMGGQNLSNTRHQPAERKLNPANVRRLSPRWVFTTGGDVSATPAVADGALYVPDWGGNLFKIETRTGKLIWSRRIEEYAPIPRSLIPLVSRTSPALADGVLYLGTQRGATMLAVNAANGDLIWKTQLDTHPAATITQSPVVFQNRLYVGVSSEEEAAPTFIEGYECCTFRGSVVALDIRTGSVIWKRYMTLDNNGKPGGFAGASVWGSTPVVDAVRNSLYVTTGNNYDTPLEVKACEEARRANPTLPSCGVPGNLIDAIVALDLQTGAVKWSITANYDAWNFACATPLGPARKCPDPPGVDLDFAQGPMLFSVQRNGQSEDLVGAGQKSGIFWALDPNTGTVRWRTAVGPGSVIGGMMWGSATDGQRIYVAISNTKREVNPPDNSGGEGTRGGAWSALDPATGKILWTTKTPWFSFAKSPITVANGVIYAGSLFWFGNNMFALDAATGAILWGYPSGGSVNGGAAVVDGTVYWGSGYGNKFIGRPNNKLYAFDVGN